MIWEVYQQSKIAEAKQAANDAQAKASGQAYDITSIHQKLELLSLSCQAMWELLRDHSDLTEKDN